MSTPMTGIAAEPMGPAEIFFSFKGRVSRRTWWLYGVLALIGLGLLGMALLRIAGFTSVVAETTVNVLLIWPAVAVSVKRWHDRNKAGWWVLVNLIPFVGWLWALVENGFLPGTKGANRFGDDPLINSGP